VDGWEETISNSFGSGMIFAALPGEPQNEPDDKYAIGVGGFLGLQKYNGIARRICNNYDVSVEFQ
jgi:hypothetical protein